ncbi:hypothetical protein [Allomuricauda sp. ARW1Y1]|jgi:hypothetical protein|uniref:hypothetical protein n=1 Tax=Allomuricauda sp. ARW1Y1 TaxID=2663843 RepID=UPI0015CDC60A|nr:hypothetical protein [Muricauda sp. ARW1Y1]NYJ28102.1 hypothetical protein [Muricauda sp. ARW1Y1]
MEIVQLNDIEYDSFLNLNVLEKGTDVIRHVIISRNSYGGGDLTIDNLAFEHYEDFDELISFFWVRFRM